MENDRKESSGGKHRQMLTGMFSDKESSENAYQTLHDLGYSSDDITLIMSDETRQKYFTDDDEAETETNAAQNSGDDSDMDDRVGDMGGIVGAIETSFQIPGEKILIAGPIVSDVAHATSIRGGVNGVLIDVGVTEALAKSYVSGIKKGQIVIGVSTRTEEDADEIESSWDSYNGHEIHRLN